MTPALVLTAQAAELSRAARAWMAQDPDQVTCAELAVLLTRHEAGEPQATAALEEAFSGSLRFGTAGLRGRLGAGPHRMNRVTVIRAAAGLCAYLRQTLGDGFTVVIGYDARHNSAQFARDTAAVVTGAGGRALLFDGHCPTPVLAFAVRRLKADAGVMVTASHNPPQDNGYKVYLGGRVVSGPGQGAQVVPPYDEWISQRINAVGDVSTVPMPRGGWQSVPGRIRQEYVERASRAGRMGADRKSVV